MEVIAIIIIVLVCVYLYRHNKTSSTPSTPVAPATDHAVQESKQDKATLMDDDLNTEIKIDPDLPASTDLGAQVKADLAGDSDLNPGDKPVEDKAEPSKLAPDTTADLDPNAESAPNVNSEPEQAAEQEPIASLAEEKDAEVAITAKVSKPLALFDDASTNLKQALQKLESATDRETEHQALLNAISECYKQRKAPAYCDFGAGLATDFLALCEQLHENQQADRLKGRGFMQLSSLLADKGEFDAAQQVCQQAIAYGLSDGTVTGFEGRQARIEKAKQKQQAER